MTDVLIAMLITIVSAATPLLFAALGELVVEKSGVLNLGVEGMMVMGAIAGFAATTHSGSLALGVAGAAFIGALMASVFAFLVLVLMANQVASGLALTLFGIGLSALVGSSFVGTPLDGLDPVAIPGLSGLPVIGRLLFNHDVLVYLSLGMVLAVWWFLNRTRAGLILRAVGESHDSAHALGYPVVWIRFAAILFGGAMAGIAGAYLSMAYTPMWSENMSAGRGWIALALVVFATWRPLRVLVGAYLFGGVTIAQLHIQGAGIDVSSQLLSMLPYLATIVVLVIISRDGARVRLNAPASLGRIFHSSGSK